LAGGLRHDLVDGGRGAYGGFCHPPIIHLDIRVAGREVRGEERRRLVSEKVERLVQAGASLAWVNDTVRGSSIVMRDPEGNEFCVS